MSHMPVHLQCSDEYSASQVLYGTFELSLLRSGRYSINNVRLPHFQIFTQGSRDSFLKWWNKKIHCNYNKEDSCCFSSDECIQLVVLKFKKEPFTIDYFSHETYSLRFLSLKACTVMFNTSHRSVFAKQFAT